MLECCNCHIEKPAKEFTRQNGHGPKVYRTCNACAESSRRSREKATPQTEQFIFPDPSWARVCLTCPLTECDPSHSLCPIQVGKRKRLEVEAIIELNRMAGGDSEERIATEARFRYLTKGPKKKVMARIREASCGA